MLLEKVIGIKSDCKWSSCMGENLAKSEMVRNKMLCKLSHFVVNEKRK